MSQALTQGIPHAGRGLGDHSVLGQLFANIMRGFGFKVLYNMVDILDPFLESFPDWVSLLHFPFLAGHSPIGGRDGISTYFEDNILGAVSVMFIRIHDHDADISFATFDLLEFESATSILEIVDPNQTLFLLIFKHFRG